MHKPLAFLFAATLLLSGCNDTLPDAAVLSPGQPVSSRSDRFTGTDLEQPGRLDLLVEGSRIQGSYEAQANSTLLPPGIYPVEGQLDVASGSFRLTSPNQPDLVLQGELPAADQQFRNFSVHRTTLHSAGLLARGTSAGNYFNGTVSQFVMTDHGSNMGPLTNLRVNALLQDGTGGGVAQTLIVQMTSVDSESSRALTFHVNSPSRPMAALIYSLYDGVDLPARVGFYAFATDHNANRNRIFLSDSRAPGTFSITASDATHITASFNVQTLAAKPGSGATGSLSVSGQLELTLNP